MSETPQSFHHENEIEGEAASEKYNPIPQKLKIQPVKRRRQRPHSWKRYEPAMQKIKNRAFMMSKNATASNRLNR